MKCKKCKIEKDEENFSFKNKSIGKRKQQCKECDKNYRKNYYADNKTIAIKYSLESTRLIRIRNSQFLWDYLKINPCIKCGENDPIVLEFDHKDSFDKITEVSTMAKNGASLEKIKEEINKCDILCANCHRRKTARQFEWYKNIIK